MQRDAGYIVDIVDAARDAIEFLGPCTLDEFVEDRKTQAAVMYALLILGEATKRLSSELRASYPQVPWVQIGAMRNIMIHEYRRVNLGIVWNVVMVHLPVLLEHLEPLYPVDDD